MSIQYRILHVAVNIYKFNQKTKPNKQKGLVKHTTTSSNCCFTSIYQVARKKERKKEIEREKRLAGLQARVLKENFQSLWHLEISLQTTVSLSPTPFLLGYLSAAPRQRTIGMDFVLFLFFWFLVFSCNVSFISENAFHISLCLFS